MSTGVGLTGEQVKDRAPQRARLERLASPVLVGRGGELEAILAAALGPPTLVVVEGEAGVGKTRLVSELARALEHRGRRCYVGGCQQLREPFPLGALVEALHQASFASSALTPVCGALRPLLPELEARLPELPKPLGDRRAERHRLFRALREFTTALGETVLVLEDLHWADDATVELLRFLAPQMPPGLALICTYRREELAETSPLLSLHGHLPSETAGVHLTLHPLAKELVGELAGEILELDDVSAEFTDYLFEASGGLPFAVEEVLRLLADRRDLTHKSGVWVRPSLADIGVPMGLRDSIFERLGRLSVSAQRIVQAAAVLEIPTAGDVLAEVAGLAGARGDRAITRALSSRLLVEVGDHRYSLRHMLARQIIDEALSTPVRRRLHLRAARALEDTRPKPLARLAHHYKGAGDTKQWIRNAEAAADRAVSVDDNATAYRFLKEAVTIPGLQPRIKGRLAVKLALHALFGIEHSEAIDSVRELLDEETLTQGIRGELRACLAVLLFQTGQTETGYAEMLRSLEDLARRPALAARVMGSLALPWASHVAVDEHLRWADRAVSTAARSGNHAMQRKVAVLRVVTLLSIGDPRGREALERIPWPGPMAKEQREAALACTNLSEALLNVGHYREAEKFIREGLRLADEADDARHAAYLAINSLQCRWLVGDWDGLEENARLSVELWQDWELLRSDTEALLGLLLLVRGDLRGALRALEPLAERSSCSIGLLPAVTAALARVNLAGGGGKAALETAKGGLEVIEQKGIWAWAGDLAPVSVEALLNVDRRKEAAEFVRRFAQGLKGRNTPAASAALAVSRGLLAEADRDSDRAASAYLAAERAWRALPRPYEAARARERAGSCLLGHETRGGQELLVEALEAFRDLGASWDAARVRRSLRQHGLIPPHRRGRRGFGRELSPREAQVARLAGAGLRNREIALELFLSPRTVEAHVYAAMRKLGVTSRTELSGLLESQQAAARS